MKERLKEPRKGSEIDPETACIQTVGAPASRAFDGPFDNAARVVKGHPPRRGMPDVPQDYSGTRVLEAGVTAYLLHNGSATYILWQA